MDKTSLGDRMKAYEGINSGKLMPKVPVIARLDGKAFHTFTKGLERPWDRGYNAAMGHAVWELCRYVDGVKLAYTQSDEVSLLLVDYESYLTQPYMGYKIQKLCSILASRMSVDFYRYFKCQYPESDKMGIFDCRVFNLPAHEVANYFVWRQQDCTRNSINSLGQSQFSHRELQKKSTNQVQDMLMTERGINWNDCPIPQKRGVCVEKREGAWIIDHQIPIFTKDKEYINKHVDVLGEKDPE